MHRIGQKTTLQERVTIGKLAIAGQTDVQIALKLDCSVWTVRNQSAQSGELPAREHPEAGRC